MSIEKNYNFKVYNFNYLQIKSMSKQIDFYLFPELEMHQPIQVVLFHSSGPSLLSWTLP